MGHLLWRSCLLGIVFVAITAAFIGSYIVAFVQWVGSLRGFTSRHTSMQLLQVAYPRLLRKAKLVARKAKRLLVGHFGPTRVLDVKGH